MAYSTQIPWEYSSLVPYEGWNPCTASLLTWSFTDDLYYVYKFP